jgi:hypothetical protein
MTDINGKRHNLTVPADYLNPESWKTQLSRRRDALSPLWQGLFAQSTANGLPLLNAVRSVKNTSASFFDGKVMLAGEALIQVRPHLGASCSIPALQAMNLADVLEGKKNPKDAEQEVTAYATEQYTGSEATGIFCMTGKWPEGHVPFYEHVAEYANELAQMSDRCVDANAVSSRAH